MKRITAFLLALALCALVFVGCTKTPDPKPATDVLENAKEYLYAMYKDSAEKAVNIRVIKINDEGNYIDNKNIEVK